MKCPECGHKFVPASSLYLGDMTPIPTLGGVEYWQDHYPDGDIPPYPTGIMGDIMPTVRKCDCGKLFWTADNSRWKCGECQK